jgi:signal transduction histidine kinase
MRSLLKYDSFDIEMAAPIANVLKVEEEYSFLDLEEHQEDLIFGKKNHRGTQGLEIQFVELSPESISNNSIIYF